MKPVPSKGPPKSILRVRQPLPITPLSLELSQRIPPEVFDIIIEKLAHFDTLTLLTCTLVCKSWLAASRSQLFTTVTLDEWNVMSFLQLLDSPHSTIASGIYHVSIQYDSGAVSPQTSSTHKTGKRLKNFLDARGYRGDASLLRRLSRFTSLRSLRFSWVTDGMDPTISTLHGFPSLTNLEFRACSFPSFRQFADMVCALQKLRRLALSDVKWFNTKVPKSSSKQTIPPGLNVLELYIAPISHVCTWLVSHSSGLRALETIKFSSAFWRGTDAASIGQLLHQLGPQVKHLSLPWHLPEVDLSHHCELRSLHITHVRLWPNLPAEDCVTARGIEKTLSQLSSSHITAITFNIMIPHTVDPNALILDWDRISEILARPSFAQLEVITLGLPSHDRNFNSLLKKMRRPSHIERARGPVVARRRSGFDKLQVDELAVAFSNRTSLASP